MDELEPVRTTWNVPPLLITPNPGVLHDREENLCCNHVAVCTHDPGFKAEGVGLVGARGRMGVGAVRQC